MSSALGIFSGQPSYLLGPSFLCLQGGSSRQLWVTSVELLSTWAELVCEKLSGMKIASVLAGRVSKDFCVPKYMAAASVEPAPEQLPLIHAQDAGVVYRHVHACPTVTSQLSCTGLPRRLASAASCILRGVWGQCFKGDWHLFAMLSQFCCFWKVLILIFWCAEAASIARADADRGLWMHCGRSCWQRLDRQGAAQRLQDVRSLL